MNSRDFTKFRFDNSVIFGLIIMYWLPVLDDYYTVGVLLWLQTC